MRLKGKLYPIQIQKNLNIRRIGLQIPCPVHHWFAHDQQLKEQNAIIGPQLELYRHSPIMLQGSSSVRKMKVF